jgi:hypothetical protein
MNEEERKYSYKRLFCEIIDVVCRNISVRFSENANLLFLSLLNARYFPMYRTSLTPLWSSAQSSWLQIRRLGFDSRHYQKKKYWVWNVVHSAS